MTYFNWPNRQIYNTKKAFSIILIYFFLSIGFSSFSQSNNDIQDTRSKEYALAILKKMSDHLAGLSHFSYQLEVIDEYNYVDSVQIQMEKYSDVIFNREQGLWVSLKTEYRYKRFWFDGSSISLLTLPGNFYSTDKVLGGNDKVLDQVYNNYNITLPLPDLLYSNPYKVLTEFVTDGFYAGLHNVDKKLCHHLVFMQDNIDWQIWIEESPSALPVKVVITYKSQFGQPSQVVKIRNWNFLPSAADQPFNFIPPPDAEEIKFLTN